MSKKEKNLFVVNFPPTIYNSRFAVPVLSKISLSGLKVLRPSQELNTHKNKAQ